MQTITTTNNSISYQNATIIFPKGQNPVAALHAKITDLAEIGPINVKLTVEGVFTTFWFEEEVDAFLVFQELI